MFQINIVEKNKTHFMMDNFFRKSCLLGDNVEKYGGATNDNLIRRIRFTHTHREYIKLDFQLQKWFREP